MKNIGFFCHNTATQWLFKVTSGKYNSVHVEAAARVSNLSLTINDFFRAIRGMLWAFTTPFCCCLFKTTFYPPRPPPRKRPCLVSGCVFGEGSDVGGGQAGRVGRGEEVAEAPLRQVAVFVIVEGLTRQLAEEVAAVQGAAGAVVPLQGAARRREGLRAAAAVEAAKGQNTVN